MAYFIIVPRQEFEEEEGIRRVVEDGKCLVVWANGPNAVFAQLGVRSTRVSFGGDCYPRRQRWHLRIPDSLMRGQGTQFHGLPVVRGGEDSPEPYDLIMMPVNGV